MMILILKSNGVHKVAQNKKKIGLLKESTEKSALVNVLIYF